MEKMNETEPTIEQTEQLKKINQRLIKIFPELKSYKIELKYEDLKGNVYGQIGFKIKSGKLDPLESLKKAKPIFKNYILESIYISFNKKLLSLKGGVRKDILFFIGSHELTHFLELPKSLTSQELGINFDAHSNQFYETHRERYNQFKISRNEKEIENIKQFEQIISMTINQVLDDKELEGQLIGKGWD